MMHAKRAPQPRSHRDTAWKNGGGREYREALKRALADAHADRFKILIVWALDRIVRDDEGGAEAALRIMRQFRQAGVMVVSVKEPWLNASREVQDVLVAFAGWMAERESARRSEPIRTGLPDPPRQAEPDSERNLTKRERVEWSLARLADEDVPVVAWRMLGGWLPAALDAATRMRSRTSCGRARVPSRSPGGPGVISPAPSTWTTSRSCLAAGAGADGGLAGERGAPRRHGEASARHESAS